MTRGLFSSKIYFKIWGKCHKWLFGIWNYLNWLLYRWPSVLELNHKVVIFYLIFLPCPLHTHTLLQRLSQGKLWDRLFRLFFIIFPLTEIFNKIMCFNELWVYCVKSLFKIFCMTPIHRCAFCMIIEKGLLTPETIYMIKHCFFF